MTPIDLHPLRLNIHFHIQTLDGVYVRNEDDGRLELFGMPEPTNEEVTNVAIDIRKKVLRHLERAGYDLGEADVYDDFADREPLLALCTQASLTGIVANGDNAGQPVERLRLDAAPTLFELTSTRCVNVDGFAVHANRRVRASDRKGLEKLMRYAARGPVANSRLRELPDGRIAYELKRVWSDGSTAVVFSPQDLMAKLAPLIPPPRAHQTIYYGVLSQAAAWRPEVVPKEAKSRSESRPNYCWSELMKRAYAYEVLTCPRCGGQMRLVAVIMKRENIEAILKASGFPTDSPTQAPAALPPQPELDFDNHVFNDDWEAA